MILNIFKSLDCVFLKLDYNKKKKLFASPCPNSQILSYFFCQVFMEIKAPSKVKAFAWLVAHRNVNTNDMAKWRRPYKSLSVYW